MFQWCIVLWLLTGSHPRGASNRPFPLLLTSQLGELLAYLASHRLGEETRAVARGMVADVTLCTAVLAAEKQKLAVGGTQVKK